MKLFMILFLQGFILVKNTEVLEQTALLFSDWARNEINNNKVLYKNGFPYINANNTWIFENRNDTISIITPQNKNTSIYIYNMNSIVIQTSKKLGNKKCEDLSIFNLNNIQIRYMLNDNWVTFRLPDMEYRLDSEDLILKVPFNTFISSEIQVRILNIPNGNTTCIRFDFIGSIMNESHIIGYETTKPVGGELPDYQIDGKVCDKAYNICSGGIAYILSRDDSSMEEIANPTERLMWKCESEDPCKINIKILLDYSVLIKRLTVSGLTIRNRPLPKILLPWVKYCLTGESVFGGIFGMYQIYEESFKIWGKKSSNIFTFDICLDPGDTVEVYNVGIYDIFDKKISFREEVIMQPNAMASVTKEFDQVSLGIVSFLAAILIIIFSVVVLILVIKNYQQKKLILTLSRATKWKSMTLPLVPDNSRLTESDFYDEIGDRSQIFHQSISPKVKSKKRGESKINFTENFVLYEGSLKNNSTPARPEEPNTGSINTGLQRNTVSKSIKNEENNHRKETFYDYNNLKHL